MNKRPLPELLAPAGSYDALVAAVEAGADAVYLGGLSFSARANATNFDEESAARGVEYCHTFGVKVYAAMNTLLFDREGEEFLKMAAAFYRMGVDALIVADLGGMRLLRRFIPDMPIHASTQASVHSVDGARALAALGASRVVLARELSLDNIRAFTTHGYPQSPLTQKERRSIAPLFSHEATHGCPETEIFIHGALCVSHSGQCLLSSMIGGRSGNRGACAQPCRLPYGKGYPLSLRDLSTADHIPALIETGVSSLKIEGRMKSPSYVFGAVEIYRRLLDGRRAATKEENRRLRELFSRDGFTDAYLRGKPTEPMTGRRGDEDKSASRALPPPPAPSRRVKLTAEATVTADTPATLTLIREDGRLSSATGDIPAAARSAPLTEDGVKDRLSRMGGTPYLLSPTDIRLSLGEGLNLSPASLNALRREALAGFSAPDPDRASFSLPEGAGRIPPHTGEAVDPPFRTTLFFDPAVYDAMGEGELSYFDICFLPLFRYAECARRPSGVYLPPVVTDRERPAVLAALAEAKKDGIAYALCGNLGMLSAVLEAGLVPIGDFRLNATNRESVETLFSLGFERIILSPELTLPRLRDIGAGSVIVYGRLPLMLLERCFIRENFGCEKCNRASLTDRRGARFPLLREWQHRNLLLNSLPTYLGDMRDRLADCRIGGEHFLFTVESAEEVRRVMRDYRAGRKTAVPTRGLPKN